MIYIYTTRIGRESDYLNTARSDTYSYRPARTYLRRYDKDAPLCPTILYTRNYSRTASLGSTSRRRSTAGSDGRPCKARGRRRIPKRQAASRAAGSARSFALLHRYGLYRPSGERTRRVRARRTTIKQPPKPRVPPLSNKPINPKTADRLVIGDENGRPRQVTMFCGELDNISTMNSSTKRKKKTSV